MTTMFLGIEFVRIKSLFEIYFGDIPNPSSCSIHSTMLIINSTYKTNKYRLPLFGIVLCYFYEDHFFSRFFFFGILKREQYYTGFGNMQYYVEGPRKHAKSHKHQS